MGEVSLNINFNSTLECPICFDYYSPPIYICPNGHSICYRCCKSSRCPLCRTKYEKISRNFVLENILDQISIACKFQGCSQQITIANRQNHYEVCEFNNYLKCIECSSSEEDLVAHLIGLHDYKEIKMQETGGERSFSGPIESWESDTKWPMGIWKFGSEPVIVLAKISSGVFHLHLYKLSKPEIKISLTFKNDKYELHFESLIPHISEFVNSATLPHFNCEAGLLKNSFATRQIDDEDQLQLLVSVRKF
mmetsp:Transcript_2683/g.4188  ORF Transcript_2683/g.4188 Transcript_2683/m.4188 type:complete len:250 (+) Transcript_2683:24-773(+)